MTFILSQHRWLAAMTQDMKRKDKPEKTDFSWLDAFHLGGIERSIAAGEYVDGAELAAALRRHGSRPIPPDVLDYLYRFLEGRVDKPRGRKAWPEAEIRNFHTVIRGLYRKHLERLTERKRRHGRPAGWTNLEGTPAEISARIVARRFLYGAESWRTVQNTASSYK